MKLTDLDLEQVIYTALRRCSHSLEDSVVAERIATALIRAEASILPKPDQEDG